MTPTPTRRLLAACCWAAALMAAPASAQDAASASGSTLGTIERFDPRFDKLIPPGAKVEKIGEGYEWSEGPVWDRKGGFLLFSDVPMNVVYRWTPGMASPAAFLKPSGYTGTVPRGGEPGSNGLVRDPQGRLVLCQHGDRRVARLEADGSFETLVDRYEGRSSTAPTTPCTTPTARSTHRPPYAWSARTTTRRRSCRSTASTGSPPTAS